MKSIKNKGITSYSENFKIRAIKFKVLGLIIGCIREKRVHEAVYGLFCFLFYRPSPCQQENIIEPINKSFNTFQVNIQNILINSREETISMVSDDKFVLGEYDNPGSRIAYIENTVIYLYQPYQNDSLVYHIHCIHHINDDFYYVTVGDTAKYLDIVKINSTECTIVKRVMSKLAGFTAMITLNDETWAGTDFSHRPNYLLNLETGEKIFLPRPAFTEYISVIRKFTDCKIEIMTKKLSFNSGCQLIFNTKSKKFESCKSISYSNERLCCTKI